MFILIDMGCAQPWPKKLIFSGHSKSRERCIIDQRAKNKGLSDHGTFILAPHTHTPPPPLKLMGHHGRKTGKNIEWEMEKCYKMLSFGHNVFIAIINSQQ